jgi:hypothetical protein
MQDKARVMVDCEGRGLRVLGQMYKLIRVEACFLEHHDRKRPRTEALWRLIYVC